MLNRTENKNKKQVTFYFVNQISIKHVKRASSKIIKEWERNYLTVFHINKGFENNKVSKELV